MDSLLGRCTTETVLEPMKRYTADFFTLKHNLSCPSWSADGETVCCRCASPSPKNAMLSANTGWLCSIQPPAGAVTHRLTAAPLHQESYEDSQQSTNLPTRFGGGTAHQAGEVNDWTREVARSEQHGLVSQAPMVAVLQIATFGGSGPSLNRFTAVP